MTEAFAAYHPVKAHDRWQQHGVGLAVRNMQRRPWLVRHRMTQPQTSAGKGHSRHTGGQQHIFTRRQIVAVTHGFRQRFANHRYRANRQAVGKRRGVERAVGLNRMRQRIDTGHCRHVWRNAFGHGSIKNRYVRH
ncbi:Uncharacterised protein [Salmonella enterica subsp. enterica serovar Bovismorbificans]|uniref:Uncharacterized protein n=1 Tax=Salmonella enterica subsp. enterica serovar Bovismorbificans TaxID=58097 RepID=A0A655DKW7_SALET|nr:Uncharacterised protein [Salmonella enterica subsp. enterica serovar Bovismorbificans]